MIVSTISATPAWRRSPAPVASAAINAMVFPSNVSGSDTAAPYSVLQYLDPDVNGLPPLGPGDAGITFIWRVKYRPQTGYHVLFWYGRGDGTIDPPSSHLYFGAHPYPQSANNTGTTHYWEVAGEAADALNNQNASPVAVTKDTYFRQALRVTNNAGAADLRFWIDLDNVSNATRIDHTLSSTYVANIPTDCRIIIGDSPWYASYQHERLGGSLAEYMIIAKSMSEADIITQGQNLQSLNTTDSTNNIWYGKKSWDTVDDLTCDFGTGRSFTRVDASSLLSVEAV